MRLSYWRMTVTLPSISNLRPTDPASGPAAARHLLANTSGASVRPLRAAVLLRPEKKGVAESSGRATGVTVAPTMLAFALKHWETVVQFLVTAWMASIARNFQITLSVYSSNT